MSLTDVEAVRDRKSIGRLPAPGISGLGITFGYGGTVAAPWFWASEMCWLDWTISRHVTSAQAASYTRIGTSSNTTPSGRPGNLVAQNGFRPAESNRNREVTSRSGAARCAAGW
jgi:hypothetical protein